MSNKTTINGQEYPTLIEGCSANPVLKYDTVLKKLKKNGGKCEITVKFKYVIEIDKTEKIT